jgi:hypothetical protein
MNKKSYDTLTEIVEQLELCNYQTPDGYHELKMNAAFSALKNIAQQSSGVILIAGERKRQIEVEGWTAEHDAKHIDGELADAAAFYAMTDDARSFIDENWGNDMWLHLWPFDLKWLKLTPDDRIKQLTKAGALIASEIDRLNVLNNSLNNI